MKIKTEKKHRFGKKVVFGGIVVEFNFDGEAQIQDTELATILLHDNQIKQLNTQIDSIEPIIEPISEPEVKEDVLEKMLLPELKDLCKQSELPSSEWAKLKKPELIEYLKNKMK